MSRGSVRARRLLLACLGFAGCSKTDQIAWARPEAGERAVIVVVERALGDVEATGGDSDSLFIDDLMNNDRATALFYEDALSNLGLEAGPLRNDPQGVALEGYVRALQMSSDDLAWQPVDEVSEAVRSFRAARPGPACPSITVRWKEELDVTNTSSTANPVIPLVRMDENSALLIRASRYAAPRFWIIDAEGVQERPELAEALPDLRIAGAAERDGVVWISAETEDQTAKILRGTFAEGFVEVASEQFRDPPHWLLAAGGSEVGTVYGLDVKETLSRADDSGWETLATGERHGWNTGRHLAWVAERDILWITPSGDALYRWTDGDVTRELSTTTTELRAVAALDRARIFTAEYDISMAQQRTALSVWQDGALRPLTDVGFAVLWMGPHHGDGLLLAGAAGTLQVLPNSDEALCDPVSFGITAYPDRIVPIRGGYAVSGYIQDIQNARRSNLFAGFAAEQ